MTKTKTLQTLVCALALLGAVAVVPTKGAATPTQTVVATASTAGTTSDSSTSTTSAKGAPATTATTGLSVSRLVVATGVSEREPVGAASTFSIAATARVYAFVELANPTAEATTIELAWLDLATGKEQRSYTLEVQAHKRWRTWARATVPKQPGAWAVLVRDQNGIELARTPYTLSE